MEDMAIDPVSCEEEDQGADEYDAIIATDDVTGKPLDPKRVQEARADELRELERLQVYDVVDTELCWRTTGRPPITARWIDNDKGTEEESKYRSRFVA